MFCSINSKESDIIRNIASKLSGYPLSHVEYTQVVRYKDGQGFSEHYDTNPKDKSNPSWSRLATFMIYLNDDFIGGETEFTIHNQIIQPEQCKGIFWWNVNQDELINESKHKGRYVIDGTKWIVNTWVHSIPIMEEKLKWSVITI
jgi:prolyl 4-hydroxylase